MTDAMEWDDEQRAELVAAELTKLGLSAYAQDTGGGIICVAVERAGGGEILWGTADVTWGAIVTDEDGEQIGSVGSECRSDSSDATAIAKELLQASVVHGAAKTGT